MTVQVVEAVLSGDGTTGVQSERERVYYSLYESDAETAEEAVKDAAGSYFRGLPLRTIKQKQVTDTVYEWTLNYGVDQSQIQPSDPDAAEFNTTLAFNQVGGTIHITTALDTESYPTSTAVDVNKVIGIDIRTGQVRGVEIFAPVMDYSLTTQFDNSVVDNTFIDAIYNLTGKVNNATFYRRAAGSVLFKGARGTKSGSERWQISFEFAYSPNKTGLTIGSITGVDKLGWQYLEVMYKEGRVFTPTGTKLQTPAQVNVHTVYESGDFSGLRIGTG